MKVGVIIGSTRKGRMGDQVAHWVAHTAAAAEAGAGATFEIVDLAEHNLALFDSDVHPAMANKQYADPAVQAWSDVIDSFDAYIFVTPEYNHSVPAPMKNAFDMLFGEWANKPVALVSYGAAGGVRAAEHWRAIVANASMLDARAQVTAFLDSDFVNNVFTPNPQLVANLEELVRELRALTAASQAMRVSA